MAFGFGVTPEARQIAKIAGKSLAVAALLLGVNGTTLRAQTVTTTVAVGASPLEEVVNPVTNKIYVVNTGDNSISVIDGATNAATVTLNPGAQPGALAVNRLTNKIYVTEPLNGAVAVIDGSTNDVSTISLPSGGELADIAVNPYTNKIYVADSGNDSITEIDGTSGAATTFPAAPGRQAQSIEINPITNLVYVACGDGTLEVYSGLTNAIVTSLNLGGSSPGIYVDPVTNKIYTISNGVVQVFDGMLHLLTTIATPSASDLAINTVTNKIYVSSYNAGTVSVIDGASDAVTATLTAAGGLDLVAVDPTTNLVYVTNEQSNSILIVDGATNAMTTISDPNANFPEVLAINPVTDKAYVTNISNNVTVIDGATNSVATVTDPGAIDVAIAAVNPVTNKIYVANDGSDTVTVIDGATNATASVSVGSVPAAVAVDPFTNQIYVANEYGNDVTVIDGATNNTTTLAVGTMPVALAVDPVRNRIFVANSGSNTVSEIDGATNTTTTINVGNQPVAIAVNPATNKIYAVNGSGHSVTVIDGLTNATTTVPVGPSPGFVAVNPVTNKIYVPNISGGTITVIDGATNAATTLALGGTPYGIALNPFSNKIYVGDTYAATISVIDGASNAISTIATVSGSGSANNFAIDLATNKIYVAYQNRAIVTAIDGTTNSTRNFAVGDPLSLAVNPVTGKVYIPDSLDNNVAVLTEANSASIPLAATIQGLSGNSTPEASPVFNVSAATQFSPNAEPTDGVFFQADTLQGLWTSAAANGNGSFTGTIVATLQPGFHILYAYATDGQEASAAPWKNDLIGSISAYGFVVTTPMASLSPAALDFGNQPLGTQSAFKPVTLLIQGASMTVSGITVTGANAADFAAFNDCPSTFTGDSTCYIQIAFTPSISGAESAALTVTDDSVGVSGATQTVALSGTGAGTTFTIAPSVVPSFGSVSVGNSSADQTLTVTNTGSGTLAFVGITATSEFTIDTTATTCAVSSSVAPNGTCVIAVKFVPASGGVRNDTLSIATNSANTPTTLILSGTGESFQLAFSSSSLSVTKGGTATYNLTIASEGGFTGAVALACEVSPGITCSITPASVSLNGTSSGTATLSVVATAASKTAPPTKVQPPTGWRTLWPVSLAGLISLWLMSLFAAQRPRKQVFAFASVALVLCCALFFVACGGGESKTVTQTGTYNVVVTGTSSGITQTANVSLTVQ